jgi:Fe-S cluster assembly ATPase SufC
VARATIEVSELSVVREGRVVLDRVSLAVAPRSIHAVMGPHGAGKSTLVAAVATARE